MFARIEINESRCKGCGLCTVACPRMLLKLGDEKNENDYAFIVITAQENCVGCALCAGMCPAIAIDVFSRQRNEFTGKRNRSFAIYSRMLSRLKK
jgi:2-oxoglutarate ferredoxin oxidoreductase subunit delta